MSDSQMPQKQSSSFDVLGYEVFLPGEKSLLFYFGKFRDTLAGSQSESHRRLAMEGQEIDRAAVTQSGSFLVQTGKEAVEFYGMAKTTYLREKIIQEVQPQIIHQ